jgi:hypothetical protein
MDEDPRALIGQAVSMRGRTSILGSMLRWHARS